MAQQVIEILPIPPEVVSGDKSFRNALAEKGKRSFFGTTKGFLPLKGKNGKYLTGLDENTPEINAMMNPEKDQTKEQIRLKRERLESETGLKLGPNDDYYSKAYQRDNNATGVAVRVQLSDKPRKFNFADPYQEIEFLWLSQLSKYIAPTLEKYKKGLCGEDVEWYISNPEAEADLIYAENQDTFKAEKAWDAMSIEKRKKVAKLLGLPINDTDKETYIFNMGMKFIKAGSITEGEFRGQKAVSMFNRIANLSDKLIAFKALIKDALNLRVYTKKGDKFFEGVSVIADSESDLIKELTTNQEAFVALEIKVEDKKKLRQLAS